jgi:hypothetical protein
MTAGSGRLRISALVALGTLALSGCLRAGSSLANRTPFYGPGLWFSPGGVNCYWERDRGFSGDVTKDIIANHGGAGPTYVQVDPGDAALKVDGCLPFEREDPPGPFAGWFRHDPGEPYPAGQYRVGVDIEPGIYASAGPVAGRNNCYWERESNFGGSDDAIILSNLTHGRSIVTIEPGDVGFSQQGCQPFGRVVVSWPTAPAGALG